MLDEIKTIAIYGLSNNTKTFLDQIQGRYTVVGLLDGYKQSGEMYGQKVISIEEAIKCGVQAIVIVARPSSTMIIVNRIRELCISNFIEVYDVLGNDLLGDKAENIAIKGELGVSKKELLSYIDESEVVSFDIFDTLLTRSVLFPMDVFNLVENKLVEKYGQGYDFANMRMQVEREICREEEPSIEDIYNEISRILGWDSKLADIIKEIEWQVEKSVIVPRCDMCDILKYAVEKGKKVYLISDMYYFSEQLEQLLVENGVLGYQEIIVSCEYGVSKAQGLFDIFRQKVIAEKYLHIGDNYLSDVVSAEKSHINGVWIRSGLDLFYMMPWSKVFDDCNRLPNRVKLGLLISKMFNSPFALEEEKVIIKKAQDFGYLLLAPIITDFVLWLFEELSEKKHVGILFAARDGYLIKKLYDVLLENCKNKDNQLSVYFYISRISAVFASIFNVEDILQIESEPFSGSFAEKFKTKFMMSEEDIAVLKNDIYDYVDSILDRSSLSRKNYIKYINSLQLYNKPIIFYDFVSSGTCQLSLEKIIDKKIHGYYFMKVKSNNCEKRKLEIKSFYNEDEVDSYIYKIYFVLESLLTSPMPSLKELDDQGKPIYMAENRSDDELEFIQEVQNGIMDYFKMYLNIVGVTSDAESRKCSEKILSILDKVFVNNKIFNHMRWEDEYFNRTVNVIDLM